MDLTGIQRSGNETRGWGVSQSLAFVNCMSHVILAGTHNWKRSRGFAVLMSFPRTRFIFSIPGENLLLFTLPMKANCSRLRWGGPSCRVWGIREEESDEEKQLLLQSFVYKVQTLQSKENVNAFLGNHSVYRGSRGSPVNVHDLDCMETDDLVKTHTGTGRTCKINKQEPWKCHPIISY